MTNQKSKCCNADLLTIIYGDMACYACEQCKKRYDVEGMKHIEAKTPYDTLLNQATEEARQKCQHCQPSPEDEPEKCKTCYQGLGHMVRTNEPRCKNPQCKEYKKSIIPPQEQVKCECNKYLKISNYVSHCPLHFPSQYDVKTKYVLKHENDTTRVSKIDDLITLIQAAKEEGYKQGCEEQRKKDMALIDSCKKEISRNVMQSSYDFNKGLATAKEKILNQKN